jgi:hypothetical protein
MSAPSTLQRLRQAHAALAPVVVLPLLVTALTGVSYRLLRDWAGLDRDGAHLLMVIHEGEWLRPLVGSRGETVYVLLNGLGLLWMLASGLGMVSQSLRRRWQRRASKSASVAATAGGRTEVDAEP